MAPTSTPANPDVVPADGSGLPAAKRLKQAAEVADDNLAAASRASAFSPGLLDSAASYAAAYATGKPYPHVAVPRLFDDALLRAVRAECLGAIHSTHKETDIYRVFQSGDMANLDGLPGAERARLRTLNRLRDAVYGPEFRAFVEVVCHLRPGTISPSKHDMSFNIYRDGCHLLCHDDVIGSRCVSFIIYLTDPDAPWTLEDGGALELFPVVSKGVPSGTPDVIIPPAWNQIAFFGVLPGFSFHAVSEVLSKGRDRLSIQGWFHYRQPEDAPCESVPDRQEDVQAGAPASLEQLTSDEGLPFEPLTSISFNPGVEPVLDTANPPTNEKEDDEDDLDDVPLTSEELEELRPFINPDYLDPTTIMRANQRFVEESSIQLTNFLRPDLAAELLGLLNEADRSDGLYRRDDEANLLNRPPPPNYGAGIRGDWVPSGAAHKHRFVQLSETSGTAAASDGDSLATAGARLRALRDTLLPSGAFRRFLYLLTSLRPIALRRAARRFRPGMDYTLATATPASGVLDATLCLVRDASPALRAVWESEDVGGFECFMAPDDGNDDPAQYRAAGSGGGGGGYGAANVGDGGALLNVAAANNSLSIVMRDPGVLKFVKYVGGAAPGSRWDVAAEYLYV